MSRRVLMAVVFALLWPTGAVGAGESPANALIREGAEHFKHEDYEGARAAFVRAYELEPKAATLFNLALSELNSDHPVEAAAHFREYLAHTGEPAQKLASVRIKWLPRAEARTARLDVFAPSGAELLVDGVEPEYATQATGSAGSPVSIAIAAGEHEVTARQGTVSEAQHVTARGGELVEVHFQRMPDAPAPSPAVGWAGSGEMPDHAMAAPPRAKWITVIALGSGAVVAAGLGVGFGIASQNSAHNAQVLQNEVSSGWTSTQCAGPLGSTPFCMKLKGDVDANRQDWTLSAVSYVGAGVLGAASLATWMLWKPKSAPVAVRPVVGAGGAGLVVGGPW